MTKAAIEPENGTKNLVAAHCPHHGPFTGPEFRPHRIRVQPRCPVCESEERARRVAEDEALMRQRTEALLSARIRDSKLPTRFLDRTITSFVAQTDAQQKALAFAIKYAGDFSAVLESGQSAVFLGRPGTGKTHLAAGIALQVIRAGHTAYFTTTIRAVRRVKDTWSRDRDETESEAIAALVRPQLLVLDEVGVQFGSEAEKVILFDVLNERYEERLPTLLLSNLTLPGVKDFLGERIFDRLREDGGQAIIFDWDSHRGQPKRNTP